MLKKKDLARALGVGPANVTRWARRGMPLHSESAAIAWRTQHIRPRMVSAPPPSVAARSVVGVVAEHAPTPPEAPPLSVGRLLAIIRELADTTDPDELEALRGALALLPREMRPRVLLPPDTYRRLLGPEILEAIAAAPGDPLTDAESDDWGWALMLWPLIRHE